MQIVSGQPRYKPHRCAVLPQKTGVNQPDERFVDTGQELPWDSHVYVSESAVRELALVFGHPSKDEHILALAKNAELEAELEAVREERDELRQEINAIDYIGSKDFIARKKVGRPKTNPTMKAA